MRLKDTQSGFALSMHDENGNERPVCQKDAYDAFISKLFNPYLPLDEQRDLFMKPLPALIGQV